jgi:agmatinase
LTSTGSTRRSHRHRHARSWRLTTLQAQQILRGLAGANIIGGDVVEVAPEYDPSHNTAHAGAQMLFTMLSLLAVNK